MPKRDFAAAIATMTNNQPTTTQAKAAAPQGVAVTAEYVEALKESYGKKWAETPKRGNPYGKKIETAEGYTRATFVVNQKQQKALREYAKGEGLQLKEALELITEIGLLTLTGQSSEAVVITEEDTAPRFERRHKSRKAGSNNQ